MKNRIQNFTFFAAVLMLALFSVEVAAQGADCDPDSPGERYRTRGFIPGTPIVITDLVYGGDDEQILDIYLPPTGDPLTTNRPIAIYAHPGGFVFQAGGMKNDEMSVLWCTEMAKMGYVAVSIEYRQNMVSVAPSGATYGIGTDGGAIRAVYLAIQDARSAIRYIKSNATTYGADPNKVFLAGSSAGGVLATNVAYMQGSERPDVTRGGWNFPFIPYSNLGCLDCGEFAVVDENQGVNGNIDAGASFWGATQDYDDGDGTLDIIDDFDDSFDGDGEIDTERMLFMHGSIDEVVLPGTGKPFGSIAGGIISGFLPDLYGTYPMRQRLNSMGAAAPQWEAYVLCEEDHEFELDQQEGGNGEYGATGMPDENIDYLLNETVDHFYDALDPNTVMPQTGPIETIVDNGAGSTLDVCDTSSKGTYAPTAYSTYKVTSPNAGSTYCWDLTKGTILTGAGTSEITVRWDDTPNAGGAGNIDDAIGRTGTVLCYEKTAAGAVETVYKASHHLALIVDGPATAPAATFSSAAGAGVGQIDFTDASVNADHPTDTYEWDFGDGTTMIGTTANPMHTYAMVGTYTVKLTVMNACGNRSDYEETVTVGGVTVAPKVYLQGPYTGPDMTTALNTSSLIPATEPYTALGFAGLQNTGTGFAASFVPGTGGDEMTDWVVVELRLAATPTVIEHSRAAVLQKDGDVVDIDGMSAVGFIGAAPGMYHVIIRHRNHLGVMTGNTVMLN